MPIEELVQFLDLGGVFIISLVLLVYVVKKMDRMATAIDKVLVVVLLMSEHLIGGNPVSNVLSKSKSELKSLLDDIANGKNV